MIVTVPALYRATVVLPGHRKERDVLLAAETHVRLQEVDPPHAIRVRGTDAPGAPSGAELPADYYATASGLRGEPRLYSDMLRVPRGSRVAVTPEELAGALWRKVDTGSMGSLSMPHGWGNPFVSAEAIDRDGDRGLDAQASRFPVIRENAPFRSVVPARQEGREAAMAHVAAAARTMSVHARSGRLLVPSIGPVLTGTDNVFVHFRTGNGVDCTRIGRQSGLSGGCYTAEEAKTFHETRESMSRLSGNFQPCRFEIDVLIPGCTSGWDPGGAGLVACLSSIATISHDWEELMDLKERIHALFGEMPDPLRETSRPLLERAHELVLQGGKVLEGSHRIRRVVEIALERSRHLGLDRTTHLPTPRA